MPTIWRLNIKPDASEGVDPRRFCIDRHILGVGWGVDSDGEIDWETYYKLAEAAYYNQGSKGWWPAVNAIKNRMRIDDLCWTRDWDGIYYLGRILSDWMYRGDWEHRAADIVNVRECDWHKVGEVDAVPGKVVNSFIPSRTVQRVNDESVGLYSQFLYNYISQQGYYELPTLSADLFSLISAEDCEDLVGIFLQERGYSLIPSSCKTHTPKYEFVLKDRETGKAAVAQVKQRGKISEPLKVAEYSGIPSEVYLFASHGDYSGTPATNVHCIDPTELKAFALANRHLMSDRLKTWIEMAEQIGTRNT